MSVKLVKSLDHTISIAHTNEVATKGMIRVSQGQWLIMAKAKAAEEIKNTSHAAPRYFLFGCMYEVFSFYPAEVDEGRAKIREEIEF
jgi:hypothetical protein